MKAASLFTGTLGLDLAADAAFGDLDWRWCVERDPHAAKVIAHHRPELVNHGDVEATDWAAVEPVDILVGGFPCQDISSAGKRAGIIEGNRSGLWFRYADAVRVVRPRLVVVENVAALLVRGLDIVLWSLADLGYDAWWTCLPASAVGAPHRRRRVFLVAADTSCLPIGLSAISEPRGSGALVAGQHLASASDAVGQPWRREAGNPEPRDGASADGGRGSAEPGGRRSASPDASGERCPWGGSPWGGSPGPADDDQGSATDADRGRLEGGPELNGRQDHGQPERQLGRHARRLGMETRWGRYRPAIRRWERVLGRPAPAPTNAAGSLNPWFVEWMQGYPEGWVCAHVGRSAALRCLGNAVVPQQGAAALTGLLADMATDLALAAAG